MAINVASRAARLAEQFPGITVHGYQSADVAPVLADAANARKAAVQAHVDLTREQEIQRLTDLADEFAVPGRPGGTVEGLTVPDMYALKAFHGWSALRGLPADAVNNTLKQARAVQRTNIALLYKEAPVRHLNMLRKELQIRGVEPRMIATRDVGVNSKGNVVEKRWETRPDGSTVGVLTGKKVPVPEAFHGINFGKFSVARAFEQAGARPLNSIDAVAGSSSKSTLHEQYMANGTPTMEGTPWVDSIDKLRAAASEHGFPLVVKEDVSSGGKGVFVALDDIDLEDIFNGVKARNGGDTPMFIAQKYTPPIGSELREATGLPKEMRVAVVDDVYEQPKVVSAYTRDGKNSGDIRQNGPNGSDYDRVDVTGHDPRLPESAIGAALRAKASSPGLSYAGNDVYFAADDSARGVRELIVEHNPSGIPADRGDVMLPREEQIVPHWADNLIWADPSNASALRGGVA